MHWLFPSFLAGMTAIAVPLLLHFLRRKPRRTILFPSLRFLVTSRQQNENAQRLRRWLVLLLRCAAFALLAVAFARPFRAANFAPDRRAIVVVIDNSLSMQANGRWEASMAWVRGEIATLLPGDRAGVLLMAPTPTWVVPLSSSPEAVTGKLAALTPGWTTGRAEPALRLAGESLAAIPADRREVLFAGDHQRITWSGCDFSRKLPDGVAFRAQAVPSSVARQAAVAAPSFSRTATGFRVQVPIRNFGPAHHRTLTVYGEAAAPLATRSIELPGMEATMVDVEFPFAGEPTSTWIRCALDPDELPADDVGYAVWQASGDHLVLLDGAPPGSAADFVGTALASTAELKPQFRVVPLPNGAWPRGAVAVLRNDASFAGDTAARLESFLKVGGSALIFVRGQAQSGWLGGVAKVPVKPLPQGKGPFEVRDWAMDHALISRLAAHRADVLLDWEFRRGWQIPLDAGEPLALWPGEGAAIAEVPVGAGRMLLCGFTADRRDGDWPVNEAFLPFVHRAVMHLANGATTAGPKPLLVGDRLSAGREAAEWRLVALARGAVKSEARPPGGEEGTSVASAPGIYQSGDGPERRLAAVNVPTVESDLEPWREGEPWRGLASSRRVPRNAVTAVPSAAMEAEQRAPLWWWPIAGVAFVILFELGIANQTSR